MHRKVALASLALLSGLILAVSSLVVPAGPAGPVKADPIVLYVAPSSDCGEASPCHATIQAAMDAAATGAMIKVAGGVYTDVHVRPRHDVTTTGVVTQVVYVSKTVTIRGGYTPTNNFADPPDIEANPTTLDALGQGRVLYVAAVGSVIIEGMNIINGGTARGEEGQIGPVAAGDGGPGAGVYNAGVLTLTSSIISSNTTGGGGWSVGGGWGGMGGAGGGLYNAGTLVLDECIIRGNQTGGGGTADRAGSGGPGGGVFNAGALMLRNSTVSGNTTGGGGLGIIWSGSGGPGGGIFNADGAVLTLTNSTVSGNATGGGFNTHSGLGGAGGAGGGLYNTGVSTLNDSTVSGNRTGDGASAVQTAIPGGGGDGGGIYNAGGAALTLVSSAVCDNTTGAGGSGEASNDATAGAGGGIYSGDGSLKLHSSVISSNAADGGGGGLYLVGSGVTLVNNLVADNQGGGLHIEGSSSHLLHTTIACNDSAYLSSGTDGDGSGIVVVSSTVALSNTILVGHTVGITVTAGSTVTLEATLWGTGTWANTTNWGGTGTIITGTINVQGDPAFVDPDAGDYHIARSSAAKDTGMNAGVTIDIDGQSRPCDGGYDIGADEFHPNPALNVTKQANPDPVQPDIPLTYTIRVTNTGNIDLHATITDTLPTFVTLARTSGSTLLPPGGPMEIIWTANITAPGGVWSDQVVVTVDEGYSGPLTNVVRVDTEEGATGTYIEKTTAIALSPVYLPLILTNPPGVSAITGEYLSVGDPCTTDPCLPGMVYAVLVEHTYYYPTVEGAWLWWNRSWDEYEPEIGDFVTVTGYVDEMVDIFGDPFYNIEVVSLEPAPSPTTPTRTVVISDVLSYGYGLDDQDPDEYVEIRNDDTQPVQLSGWTLYNAESHQVFTFPDHIMQPGQVCRVYTNEDHPEWCGFSYGSESEVWRDANGCSYLRDGVGTLVDAHCYCVSHTAYMTISATSTTLEVGDVVTVTETLFNRGCTGLGIPQYQLYVQSDTSEPMFDPSHPEPVTHALGIGKGGSDRAEFVLQAVRPGQAILGGTASFEVHLGYPGPAYWGYSGTGPITIGVTQQYGQTQADRQLRTREERPHPR